MPTRDAGVLLNALDRVAYARVQTLRTGYHFWECRLCKGTSEWATEDKHNDIAEKTNVRHSVDCVLAPDPEAWDSTRNQQELCQCGHPYERHFDSHEDMSPVGCKYCECERFVR